MSTVFTAGNNMAYKHPKVLSFHGFKTLRDEGLYLNDACTLSLYIEREHWAGVCYKSNYVLFYTKKGTIKIPYFSGALVSKVINEYLPEEYRVYIDSSDGPLLFDVENNTRHDFDNGNRGTITITNDRRVLYDEDE